MAIKAGQLRHRIKIEQPSTAVDDYGDPIETWTNWPTGSSNGFRWANSMPSGGSEVSIGGANEFVGRFTWKMRYRSGLTAGMRITHNSRVMHITSVMNVDERDWEMVAECEEAS